MNNFISKAILGFAGMTGALADKVVPDVALLKVDGHDLKLDAHEFETSDIFAYEGTSDLMLLPAPLAKNSASTPPPPGKWTDSQKLTYETFKEVVAADIENVWVIAYVDPRCRDCLVLSFEWEKLTHKEEREMRKIKLGYVDISVEENWKIMQDHTKGKKITSTPAISLYGDDKENPAWYPDKSEQKADKIHTWVSSYCDHFGYGYWDPRYYEGAGVHPHGFHYSPQKQGKIPGHYYTGNGQTYNKHLPVPNRYGYHEGALGGYGVRLGNKGYGYATAGKYHKGEQITQLKEDNRGQVLKRRTVVSGGKLTGAAHEPTKNLFFQKNPFGSRRNYGGYQGQSKYGSGYSGQVSRGGYQKGYGGYGGYGGYQKGYGSYGGRSYGGHGVSGYQGGYRMKGYHPGFSSIGKNKGTYGTPNVKYYGPGWDPKKRGLSNGKLSDLAYLFSDYGPQKGDIVYDDKLGKGIVLGKYTKETAGDVKLTDYDRKVIEQGSKAYRDAMAVAVSSDYWQGGATATSHSSKQDLSRLNLSKRPVLQGELDVPSVGDVKIAVEHGH